MFNKIGVGFDTISIHSLRTEGDIVSGFRFYIIQYFNPLPPDGGRPCINVIVERINEISIHSLRTEGDIL